MAKQSARGIQRLIAIGSLILTARARAQYLSISTNADASIVLVATRERQNGTDQPNWGKLFSVGPQGQVRPFLVRNRELNPLAAQH